MVFFWQIGAMMLVLELIVFALVVAAIGPVATIMLCAFSAFAGLYLMRHQGAGAAMKLVSGARLQPAQLLEAGALLLAGLLLFIPGFLSDLAALALLVPSLRRAFYARKRAPEGPPPEDAVIEGRYEVVEEAPPRLDEPR